MNYVHISIPIVLCLARECAEGKEEAGGCSIKTKKEENYEVEKLKFL